MCCAFDIVERALTLLGHAVRMNVESDIIVEPPSLRLPRAQVSPNSTEADVSKGLGGNRYKTIHRFTGPDPQRSSRGLRALPTMYLEGDSPGFVSATCFQQQWLSAVEWCLHTPSSVYLLSRRYNLRRTLANHWRNSGSLYSRYNHFPRARSSHHR